MWISICKLLALRKWIGILEITNRDVGDRKDSMYHEKVLFECTERDLLHQVHKAKEISQHPWM